MFSNKYSIVAAILSSVGYGKNELASDCRLVFLSEKDYLA